MLRGGGLGDLVSALPAIEALSAAYADAQIVLLCASAYAGLLKDRPSPVTEAIGLPAARGVHGPDDGPAAEVSLAAFRRSLAGRPIDLGVQLHGGGRWSNPFVLALKPRWTVGTRTPDAASLTRWLPYHLHQHEVMRWLEVAGLAGAPPVSLTPHVEVTAADLGKARMVLPESILPTVTVHPGARDPRRRWPAEHYAALAARCIEQGCRVVLIGRPAERPLLRDIAGKADARVLGGAHSRLLVTDDLDMSTLVGVLFGSDVVVGNDSGITHLAQAVGAATVGIYWLSNALKAAPLDRGRHRVFVSWTTQCAVCGQDLTKADAPLCEHDVSFVADISVDEVEAEVRLLASQSAEQRIGSPPPGDVQQAVRAYCGH